MLIVGDNELLMSYMKNSFDAEKSMMDNIRYMGNYFPSTEKYLNLLDSHNSCNEYASSVDGLFLFFTIDCMTVFRGFMSKGVTLAILRVLRTIQNYLLPLFDDPSAVLDLIPYRDEMTAISSFSS